jgi:hypothetical protein
MRRDLLRSPDIFATKSAGEISSPFCVFCALWGRDYSLELFKGLNLLQRKKAAQDRERIPPPIGFTN